jgi:hypothetical protein
MTRNQDSNNIQNLYCNANASLTKRLNGGAEVAETTVKSFNAAGFDALVKRWDNRVNVGGGYVQK